MFFAVLIISSRENYENYYEKLLDFAQDFMYTMYINLLRLTLHFPACIWTMPVIQYQLRLHWGFNCVNSTCVRARLMKLKSNIKVNSGKIHFPKFHPSYFAFPEANLKKKRRKRKIKKKGFSFFHQFDNKVMRMLFIST